MASEGVASRHRLDGRRRRLIRSMGLVASRTEAVASSSVPLPKMSRSSLVLKGGTRDLSRGRLTAAIETAITLSSRSNEGRGSTEHRRRQGAAMLSVTSGSKPPVQIATWNVNSVRTRLDQVLAWLNDVQPDLLCLQETKVDDPLFPKAAFEAAGWNVQIHGQKSYNGVALVSREPLEDVRLGFLGELPGDPDAEALGEQKRVISALLDGVRVVNLYVPNGSSLKSDKYPYKLAWLACLRRYLEAQAERGNRCAWWGFQHRPG